METLVRHVVDVADEDEVASQLDDVLEQGAVPPGAQKEPASRPEGPASASTASASVEGFWTEKQDVLASLD